MLDCNITEKLYTHIKKEQYGICSNTDVLISMALNQLRYNLGCTGVTACYVPETCEEPATVSCSLTTSQTSTVLSCVLTITQSFDDP